VHEKETTVGGALAFLTGNKGSNRRTGKKYKNKGVLMKERRHEGLGNRRKGKTISLP